MLRIDLDAISGLRALLDDLNYDAVQRTLRTNYFHWPFPAFEQFQPLIAQLPERQRVSYQVLMLGQSVRRATLEGVWTREMVSQLLGVGLLESDGTGRVRTANYGIVSFLNRFFVVSLNPYYPDSRDPDASIYIGSDSLTLATSLPLHIRFNRCLDLCTGSGIQAILAAAIAEEVIAVELDPSAANAAEFNAALNNVLSRVRVVQGNLYEAAPPGPYDLILSNPPFLPVPQDVHYAMCGNGGVDGMLILRPLLQGIPERLGDKGKALIYAEGVGDSDGPFVRHLLRELARDHSLTCHVIITSRLPVKTVLVLKAVSLQRLKRPPAEMTLWQNMYRDLRATHAYNYVLQIRRGQPEVTQLMAFDLRREEQGVEVQPGVIVKPR